MDKFEKLGVRLGEKAKLNFSLKDCTTLQIGGSAKIFIEIDEEKELIKVLKEAQKLGMALKLIGEGSNLLVSEKGYNGLVIRNKIEGVERKENEIFAKAGTSLQKLVDFAVDNGLSGMEKMTGIPGSVGGAIYGNAGAYGQTISDTLLRAKVFDGKKVQWISKKNCGFSYRESIFKKTGAAILEGEFLLSHSPVDLLRTTAASTLKIRQEKYPPGMLCPGSFFKNVEVNNLSKQQLSKIPREKILYGKVPAGHLLESVGAKGTRLGDIKIADYHANLLINLGNGKASDFYKLAQKFQERVKDKFGIKLEPEVQLLGFDKKL